MNVLYQRSPRIKPTLKEDIIEILRPQNEPNKPSFSLISILLPAIMTIFSIGFYIYMNLTGKMGNSNYMMFQMVSVMMMLTSYTIPFFVYLGNKKKYKEQMKERVRLYQAELEKHKEQLMAGHKEQVDVLFEVHGDPDVCFHVVKNRSSVLWERSYEDDDFLHTRIGTGNLPFFMKVKVPRPEGYVKDPLIEEAQRLAADFETVPDASVALPLFRAKVIGIVGERETVMNSLRVIIAQLTVRHSPDEVKLAAFYEEKDAGDWDWMRWLPHTWDEQRNQRYMSDRRSSAHQLADELFQQLSRRKSSRHEPKKKTVEIPVQVVLLSSGQLIEEEPLLPLLLEDAGEIDACTIILSDRKETLPMQCHLIVDVSQEQGHYSLKQDDGTFEQVVFVPDNLSLEKVEALSRYMAPVRLKRSLASDIPDVLSLFEMLNIKTASDLDVKLHWRNNRYPDSLPVPFGVRAGGKRINLNIHDKIERQGHGPHGLIAGTTGSGKSEVIQSIVASLAAEFHPHDLSFMLIDYKGGGMSNTFVDLPHVVGTITNLSSSLMERAKISLKAELVRRQKILNDAGNLQHIDEYYKLLRREGGQPLPHLVIIIDEFAQLKKDQPEFMDELISIAAIGRTLGVHLILATQKPAGVVDDKIWSNARFRICLRVQDEGDSRDMLKIPNAAWINKPGRGYFQVGSDELFEEMQFAWSGAPYVEQTDSPGRIVPTEIALNGKRENLLTTSMSAANLQMEQPPKQLQVFIDKLAEAAKEEGIGRLQGPWLPPLPERLELEGLTQAMHLCSEADELHGFVGIIDDLPNQSQRPLQIPMEQGHWAVYGMPGLGKTTFVQTLLMSLAQSYSPLAWNGYIVDMGRMMRDFAGLPQIGGVMLAEEDDRIKRLFRFLVKTVSVRKELFADAGVKTAAAYRRSQAGVLPQVLVVVDGYLNFRNSYPEENEMLEFILRESGNLGITFVITSNRISDIFEKVRSNIASAVTFELADASDYYYAVGRPARNPGSMPPGRGLVKGHIPPLEFQAALPAAGDDEAGRSVMLRNHILNIAKQYPDWKAPEIKKLPEQITLHELMPHPASFKQEQASNISFKVPVGLLTDDLEPFELNLAEGPHFIVASPMEGGKTSFLLSWMLSLSYHYSPEQLHMYTIDSRYGSQGLSQVKELPHVQGSASREEELSLLIGQVYEKVQQRSSGEENPAILLVIDDADILAKRLNDYMIKEQLGTIVRLGRDRNVHVLLSGVPADFPTFGVDWFNDVKACQSGFLFGTLDPNDLSFFRIPFSESGNAPGSLKILPPGQGYYIKRKFTRVKAAIPFADQWSISRWVIEIRDRWHVVV
ncbi:type VII secretion protein EssC [Paenibacillus sp.]|jgi:S-DNA-T family DNA segregation ATPase FtsK/SpoIIIE|uniref:type VII secretion protein EssC n=1 Tax=Paenibacillus sp. TaxID=58172 RepID=UPI00281D4C71|nr:type VII secretion protein EssC [Paenibacillus sp.]MDR0266677.1 type VII secretion protein EssC [Paenibacillus sp.]